MGCNCEDKCYAEKKHLRLLRNKKEGEVAQSCPTLWDPRDCVTHQASTSMEFPGLSTGVGCHVLLQGMFPTHGLNPGLPHCRQRLYHLSHQGIARGY